MKPLLALVLFMASTTLFYLQPTPNPANHLPDNASITGKSKISKYDLEVDYVTDPLEVNIP